MGDDDRSLFEARSTLPEPELVDGALRLQVHSMAAMTSKVRLHEPGRGGACTRRPTPRDAQSDRYYDAAESLMADNQLPARMHAQTICLFGRTAKEDGARSVCLHVKFPLSFVAELPSTHESREDAMTLVAAVKAQVAERREKYNERQRVASKRLLANIPMEYRVDRKTRAVGWVPDEADPTQPRKFTVVKFSFRNLQDYHEVHRLLGDELDQGATQNRAWLLALAGSTLGVGSLLAGERRLGGRPLNWPLFLGAAAVVGGLFVVLATFAPGAN